VKAKPKPCLSVGWGDFGECDGDGLIEGVDGPGLGFTEDLLEFGPGLFDGIQIGRIGRQVEQLCLTGLDALTYSIDLVGAEIIHHYHVAGVQGGA